MFMTQQGVDPCQGYLPAPAVACEVEILIKTELGVPHHGIDQFPAGFGPGIHLIRRIAVPPLPKAPRHSTASPAGSGGDDPRDADHGP